MSKTVLAIASCRVSSVEQLENNSLNRQRAAVLEAANRLGVIIPEDGWWSGSVSSKSGSNVDRKDLKEMLDRCKKDKRIKYLIVDEPDRFMRSVNEAAYFEVSFTMLGVQVWYASDPELNKRDLSSKLLKFTKYLSAEGSNEERQRKSIAGQTKAIAEGRFPFPPKPGYKRGYQRAIHEIDPTRGPALQAILIRIAEGVVTPTQGLKELNQSQFIKEGAVFYKMDKFRKMLTDPYYAGILEMDKQVKIRNENGLHEPLITKQQHYKLLQIMTDKKKNRSGPRKNGNPKYPMSNQVTCTECFGKSSKCRIVGFDNHNGKNKQRIYERYRCRSCGKYIARADLHSQVLQQFNKRCLSEEGRNNLSEALDTVWKHKQGQLAQDINRIEHEISSLHKSIGEQVEAATDPSNAFIKQDILEAIKHKKEKVHELEETLTKTRDNANEEHSQFLLFAFDFIDNMGCKFFEVSKENRLRCKQLLFPAGFWIDINKKVYTPEVSPLYRLATNKKDPSNFEKSPMVRVTRL